MPARKAGKSFTYQFAADVFKKVHGSHKKSCQTDSKSSYHAGEQEFSGILGSLSDIW
jgi:hypothetical protein